MDKPLRKPVSEEALKKKRKRRKEQESRDGKARKTHKSGKKGSKQKAAPEDLSHLDELQNVADAKSTVRASSGSSSDCHKPGRKVQK